MDNPRSAADRIRPILQAMERSIDFARSRRTNTNGRPAPPAATTPATLAAPTAPESRLQPQLIAQPATSPPSAPHAVPAAEPDHDSATTARPKARPKRSASYSGNPRPAQPRGTNGSHGASESGYRTYVW